MKGSLLAIDPGAKTGYAVFYDGKLALTGVFEPGDISKNLGSEFDLVAIENPVIYPHSKANPNSILKLARVVGRYEQYFQACRQRLVEPRDWKGTINGDIMVARILNQMTTPESLVFLKYQGGYKHNAVDAIGLGKWAMRQTWAATL
jgi:hypothetical protein